MPEVLFWCVASRDRKKSTSTWRARVSVERPQEARARCGEICTQGASNTLVSLSRKISTCTCPHSFMCTCGLRNCATVRSARFSTSESKRPSSETNLESNLHSGECEHNIGQQFATLTRTPSPQILQTHIEQHRSKRNKSVTAVKNCGGHDVSKDVFDNSNQFLSRTGMSLKKCL